MWTDRHVAALSLNLEQRSRQAGRWVADSHLEPHPTCYRLPPAVLRQQLPGQGRASWRLTAATSRLVSIQAAPLNSCILNALGDVRHLPDGLWMHAQV